MYLVDRTMIDTNGSPTTNGANATQPRLLEMRAITKRFPGVLALSEVDFDVRTGEVHALVGENGAGKSTLMKILSGVYELDSGEITFQGQPATRASRSWPASPPSTRS